MPKVLQGSKFEIKSAAQALIEGNLVAIPTETVYGLAADAMSKSAVEKIYAVKGRPKNHPVIVHIADLYSLDFWAVEIPEYARLLTKEFWPGPMTLILRASNNCGSWVSGGQDSIGLRIPRHQITNQLLIEFNKLGGQGLAAPSANQFGAVSPTSAKDVLQDLGSKLSDSDSVLDGGDCDIGIESTIINCLGDQPIILRPGAITSERIFEVLGIEPNESELIEPNSNLRFPGSMNAHYSPKAKVWIAHSGQPGDGFIALAKIQTPDGLIRIAAPKDETEFARTLYRSFRKADELGLSTIVINPLTGTGLAEAIRDRISRAAGSP